MTKYRLSLATDEESRIYGLARSGSGISEDLRYLEKDPLAVQERKQAKALRYDHVHLSVPDTNDTLVQWWGRAYSGYHYPVGRVMRIVQDEDLLPPSVATCSSITTNN